MSLRFQQTIARPATVRGIGFLTGADLEVRFLPAAAGYGRRFVRTDLSEPVEIPALVQYTAPRTRRTALEHKGTQIELIEHAMAAMAGLGIDNCRVEINGPEIPGCDGSCKPFIDALLNAGLVTLSERRCPQALTSFLNDAEQAPDIGWSARPSARPELKLTYHLDYGPESPIPAQSLTVEITPENFVEQLAYARTFILEEEVQAFLAQGMGHRLSFQDLLIYGKSGVIGNQLRAPDECVRHKILDCVGDLALLGRDLTGQITFRRTGHRHNLDVVRSVIQTSLSAGCRRDAA